MSKKRTTYSRKFKLEALSQIQESGLSVFEVADQLGLRRNQLYKWRKQQAVFGEAAFKGGGRTTKNRTTEKGRASEISVLKLQVAKLREENQLLKQAAAYFARQIS